MDAEKNKVHPIGNRQIVLLRFEKFNLTYNLSLKFRSSRSQMFFNIENFTKKTAFLLSRKDELGTTVATKIISLSNLFLFLFFCYWHGEYVPEYLQCFIKTSYRKKCIMRNLSWNTEKPSSRLAVFWKIHRKISVLKSLF